MPKAYKTIYPDKRHNSPDVTHDSPDITQPVYHGILYGVGVGPGSPDLVTLRAVNTLKSVSHVIAPTVDERVPGRAEIIIRYIIPALDIERFVFPVSNENIDGKPARDTDSIYGQLVERIAAYTIKGESVAFVTLGDPDIYSTFSHIRHLYIKRYPHMPLETIAGICAFQELAARTNTTLCIGSDTLTLAPHLHTENDHPDMLTQPDSTVVVYKGGERVQDIVDLAKTRDRLDNAVVGIHLGQERETIALLKEMKDAPQIPYLSTVIIPCREY